MRQRQELPVTIANGASLSGEINVGAHRIVGVKMPAGWTAADLSIQALVRSTSGTNPTLTFGEVVDQAGNNYALATAPGADEYVAIPDTAPLFALGRVKIRSGTAAIPVNQGAQRDFFVVIEFE